MVASPGREPTLMQAKRREQTTNALAAQFTRLFYAARAMARGDPDDTKKVFAAVLSRSTELFQHLGFDLASLVMAQIAVEEEKAIVNGVSVWKVPLSKIEARLGSAIVALHQAVADSTSSREKAKHIFNLALTSKMRVACPHFVGPLCIQGVDAIFEMIDGRRPGGAVDWRVEDADGMEVEEGSDEQDAEGGLGPAAAASAASAAAAAAAAAAASTGGVVGMEVEEGPDRQDVEGAPAAAASACSTGGVVGMEVEEGSDRQEVGVGAAAASAASEHARGGDVDEHGEGGAGGRDDSVASQADDSGAPSVAGQGGVSIRSECEGSVSLGSNDTPSEEDEEFFDSDVSSTSLGADDGPVAGGDNEGSVSLGSNDTPSEEDEEFFDSIVSSTSLGADDGTVAGGDNEGRESLGSTLNDECGSGAPPQEAGGPAPAPTATGESPSRAIVLSQGSPGSKPVQAHGVRGDAHVPIFPSESHASPSPIARALSAENQPYLRFSSRMGANGYICKCATAAREPPVSVMHRNMTFHLVSVAAR
jgi:hypothetical protein